MSAPTKLVCAAALAVALLSATFTTASANILSVDEQEFETIWNTTSPATKLSWIAAGTTTRCNVTLLGRFNARSIAKEEGEEIGRINHVAFGACEGGTLTVLTETLPWRLHYFAFSGTLPNITSINLGIIDARFAVDPAGALPACLAGTTVAEPGLGTLNLNGEGRTTSLRADETARIRLGGGFLCSLGGTSEFSGTAAVTNLAQTAPLRITLIGGPRISVSPSPVEFGTVEPESTTRRTVTIEVTGGEATVRSISVRNGTNFSITDPNGCRSSRIASGGRCAFTAIFDAPNTEGRSYEDSVTVETDVGDQTVTVRGRTTDPVAPTISPSPVAFGTLEVESLTRRAVTITAVSAVTIRGISLEVARYFAIIDPNRCASASLAREARCTFNVIAEAPAERGVAMRDTLVIDNSIEQRRVEVEGTT